MSLGEDKFLNGFAVDFFSCLLQLLVVKEIEAASRNDTGDGDEDDVGVVRSFALARDGLRAEMDQQYHVIELENRLVKEDSETPEALNDKNKHIRCKFHQK